MKFAETQFKEHNECEGDGVGDWEGGKVKVQGPFFFKEFTKKIAEIVFEICICNFCS